MKLVIRRNQEEVKGVFGGSKGFEFLLTCRVHLSQEEQALIQKYKVQDYPLTFRTIGGSQQVWHTVGSLIEGVHFRLKDVTTLLSNEEVVKSACRNFKGLLSVMATFGGEEVIEF